MKLDISVEEPGQEGTSTAPTRHINSRNGVDFLRINGEYIFFQCRFDGPYSIIWKTRNQSDLLAKILRQATMGKPLLYEFQPADKILAIIGSHEGFRIQSETDGKTVVFKQYPSNPEQELDAKTKILRALHHGPLSVYTLHQIFQANFSSIDSLYDFLENLRQEKEINRELINEQVCYSINITKFN